MTSGPAARGLQAWITSATASLPTPLSPVIRTRLSEAAIRAQSLEQGLHQGADGDDVRGQFLLFGKPDRGGFGKAGGLADGGEEFVQVNRFGKIIDSAVAHGDDGVADVGMGGDQENGEAAADLAGAAQGFQAGKAGHADIGDHHVHGLGAEDLQGALAGGDDDGLEALAGQEGVQQTALGRIVIHNEDARPGVVFGDSRMAMFSNLCRKAGRVQCEKERHFDSCKIRAAACILQQMRNTGE